VYARAIRRSGLPYRDPRLTAEQVADASAAFDILEQDRDLVEKDIRAFSLYFNLWWMGKTGVVPMQGERISLPFTQRDWEHSLALLNGLDMIDAPAMWRLFLRAIAEFHLEQPAQSTETFRHLQDLSSSRPSARRVIRTYLASASNGSPRVFHGQISRIHTNWKRADVYVEELGRTVLAMQRDFDLNVLHQGDSLGEFAIAFNFIGPVADPLRSRIRPKG
jgi:hypothetical protein